MTASCHKGLVCMCDECRARIHEAMKSGKYLDMDVRSMFPEILTKPTPGDYDNLCRQIQYEIQDLSQEVFRAVNAVYVVCPLYSDLNRRPMELLEEKLDRLRDAILAYKRNTVLMESAVEKDLDD